MAKNYTYIGNCEQDGLLHVILEVRCTECKTTKRILVDPNGYHKWINGTLIQRALPDLPKDIRELLISGFCGSCFDKLFPLDEA